MIAMVVAPCLRALIRHSILLFRLCQEGFPECQTLCPNLPLCQHIHHDPRTGLEGHTTRLAIGKDVDLASEGKVVAYHGPKKLFRHRVNCLFSFVLQQTVKARKRVSIRTPLELGKVQQVKIKKKFRNSSITSIFRNFSGARGGGLEPPRTECTLEPEFEKNRSSAYRAVSPCTAKSHDISSFFGSHACKPNNRARCKKSVVC